MSKWNTSCAIDDHKMSGDQIRAEIRARLPRLLRKSIGVRVIDELEICSGKARADMAIISDLLIGVEIKGPKDRLDRLPKQIEHYSKCFDQVILVVDESLSVDAASLIPQWWGIVQVSIRDGNNNFKLVRRPLQNQFVDVEMILALLWRPEIEVLFSQETGSPPPSRASKRRLREILLDNQSHIELKSAGIEILRNREEWRSTLL
jgi:hypothetical protein